MGRSFAVGLMSGVLMFTATTNQAQDELGLEEFLADISIWEQIYNLRLGVGYNDNLLLSELNEEQSAMVLSGFDITLFRLPIDDNYFNFFANLDARMYPDGEDIAGEATALALVQGKRDINEKWRGGLTGQYFFQDQVIDASVTEINVSTLPVRGHQFEIVNDWRYGFRTNQWLEVDAVGGRQIFQDSVLDDYWQFGGVVTYGFNYGNRSELLLNYELDRRLYDTRQQYNSLGMPLPGTNLKYFYHNVEIGSKHHFDSERKWRLYTRLGYGRNSDNGSGYFDFNRYNASVQLRYRHTPWEVRLQGRYNYYDYDQQQSDETVGEERFRGLLGGGVRGERKFRDDIRVFLEYHYERADSNLSYDKYAQNLLSTGVDWEF